MTVLCLDAPRPLPRALILVLAPTHYHRSKLWALLHHPSHGSDGGSGGTAAYCRDRLPSTRLVTLRAEGHLE